MGGWCYFVYHSYRCIDLTNKKVHWPSKRCQEALSWEVVITDWDLKGQLEFTKHRREEKEFQAKGAAYAKAPEQEGVSIASKRDWDEAVGG